jgi:hypothetical protein
MDLDPDPALFVRDLQEVKKKQIYSIFCFFLAEGTFTSFFKDKKSERSHKTVEIKVFLLFFLHDGRIRIQSSDYRILIRNAG